MFMIANTQTNLNLVSGIIIFYFLQHNFVSLITILIQHSHFPYTWMQYSNPWLILQQPFQNMYYLHV